MSTENVSVSPAANFEKCSVVLSDVQGTTSALSFFKETYFPYVTKNAEEFLKTNWDNEAVKAAVKELSEKELDLEAATKTVVELTESNSDNKGLKVLQGLITKKGYSEGELKAHVFDDVPEALETWAKTMKVAIYSTGDVDCQKRFFANTVKGDLSAHISKNFDQAVGVKTEADSYKKIAEELAVKPEEIVFLSDLEQEGKAAKTAGLSVVLVAREGKGELSEEVKKNYPVVSSFSEITFEADKACKRKNTEEAEEPPTKVAKTDESEKKVEEPEKAKDEEKVEPEETMEVDSSEKKTEETKTEEKPAETKAKVEEKMDAVDSTEKTEEKTEKAAVAEPVSTETKVEETKKADKTEEKSENEVDSTSKPTENGSVEEKKEVAKTEESDSKAEEKASSTTENGEAEPVKEKATEKPAEEKTENSVQKEDKKEAVTNGEATPAQNGEADKAEKTTNGETNGATNGDSKKDEEITEIKVKKVPAAEAESSTEVSAKV